MRRMTLLGFAVALIAPVLVETSHAAIITTTGPTYTYSWGASDNTTVDPNASYTGDGPVDGGSAIQDNKTFSRPASYTVLYQFDTPNGFKFESATVFTRMNKNQDSSADNNWVAEYSIDPGATWNHLFTNSARNTVNNTSAMPLADSETSVQIRYTSNRSASNSNANWMRLFLDNSTSDGFIFTANIVPEPASFMLMALGAACLLPRRRRG